MTAASSAGGKSARAASATRIVAVMHVTQPPGTGRIANTERSRGGGTCMNSANPTVRGGERRIPTDQANGEVPRGKKGQWRPADKRWMRTTAL